MSLNQSRKSTDGITRFRNITNNVTAQLPSGIEKNIRIGSGVIVGILGTGGMSKVYKIWNEKLEVNRAVKILYPSKKYDLSERFTTESKISAQLRHPNIIEIHDCGEWKGLPFIEMELLDGISLREIIKKYGRLPPVISAAIGLQILKALKYAHNHKYTLYNREYSGVIHRDLKPENIIISKQGFLKLMDFGVARPLEAGLHTKHGFIVGTLQYLPPELFDGEKIDFSADIYSFGAIMYELIIGKMAFPQNGFENLLKVKISGSYRRIKEFHYIIPPSFAKFIEKCLHTNKEKRYHSAAEMLDYLTIIYKSVSSKSPEKVIEDFVKDPVGYVIQQNNHFLKTFSDNISNFSNDAIKNLFEFSNSLIKFICYIFGKILFIKNISPIKKISFKNTLGIQYVLISFFIITLSITLFFLLPKAINNPEAIMKNEIKSEWNNNNWNELVFE